ncbi:hypothetical protein [Microbacterium sp.]|uniref:hypothetical protein n=1 Tax=Microbacterium sp. TaxID=51671 RepID=UPI0039E3986B
MNDDIGDESTDALRAADPAAGAVASHELRERIARIPAASDPAPARGRRLFPIAAAAAVVVALGGGYVWGAGGVGAPPASAPIAVETGTPEHPTPPIALGGGSGMVAEAQSESTATDTVSPWGYFGEHHRFVLPNLSTDAGSAQVYAVDSATLFTPEEAERIAAALGVAGTARTEDFGSLAVSGTGGAHVSLSPLGNASYWSGIPDPFTVCEEEATTLHGPRNTLNDDDALAFEQEIARCMAETPMPSDELVQDAVSSFLSALEIDEDAVDISLTPNESSRTVYAQASLIVGGSTTMITASITVYAQGIAYADGPFGDVVSLGDYPIVSPAEAAARLDDAAYFTGPIAVPEPDWISTESQLSATPTPAPVPPAGSRVPWAIAEHEIESVRLGLALVWDDGAQYLAPAYEFTATDETVWSVIALPEGSLDTAAG